MFHVKHLYMMIIYKMTKVDTPMSVGIGAITHSYRKENMQERGVQR